RARYGAARWLAPWRGGKPQAVDGLGILKVMQLREHDVALGIDVVATLTAGIAIAHPIPAGLGKSRSAPSIGKALAELTLGRRDGVCPLSRRQTEPGRAMQLGVGRIEEEAEGVLNLPNDARLGTGRHRPRQAEQQTAQHG